jgi:hypothetical protein
MRMLTLNGVQSAKRNQDAPLPDAASKLKRTRVELSTSYFVDSATYCQAAEWKLAMSTLLDMDEEHGFRNPPPFLGGGRSQ